VKRVNGHCADHILFHGIWVGDGNIDWSIIDPVKQSLEVFYREAEVPFLSISVRAHELNERSATLHLLRPPRMTMLADTPGFAATTKATLKLFILMFAVPGT